MREASTVAMSQIFTLLKDESYADLLDVHNYNMKITVYISMKTMSL